jgi:hypothetical protein
VSRDDIGSLAGCFRVADPPPLRRIKTPLTASDILQYTMNALQTRADQERHFPATHPQAEPHSDLPPTSLLYPTYLQPISSCSWVTPNFVVLSASAPPASSRLFSRMTKNRYNVMRQAKRIVTASTVISATSRAKRRDTYPFRNRHRSEEGSTRRSFPRCWRYRQWR